MTASTLQRLGLPDGARAVVLHADDLGMCQATIPATVELFACGGVSSASLMAPCPWARSAAEAILAAGAPDVGAHWTLTSEWASYRWRSLTGDPSLSDDEGQLPHTTQEVWRAAGTEAVRDELASQLAVLRGWGLTLSHADTHMGTLADPRLFPVAVEVASAHGIWPLLLRADQAGWMKRGLDEAGAARAAAAIEALEAEGWPMVDHFAWLPLEHADDHRGIAEQTLRELEPGITHFLFHPSLDTPEARAASPDWPARVANFEAMRDPRIQRVIEAEDIVVLPYSALQQVMPTGAVLSDGVAS